MADSSDIEIRRMRPEDLPQVLDLLRYWNLAPIAPTPEIPDPERTELIRENASVAVVQERIVGIGSFIQISPTEAEGASFAVAPEYRGTRIGSLLVIAGRREMYARGIRRVYSETDRPENVNWLVKRFGYRIVGKVAKRHPFGDSGIAHWTKLEAEIAPPFGSAD
jgi:N-acetylglutamate synthase-like GNAT family acetyltransferase